MSSTKEGDVEQGSEHHDVDGTRGHTRDHAGEHTRFEDGVGSPNGAHLEHIGDSESPVSPTSSKKHDDDGPEEEIPKLSVTMALVLLAFATVVRYLFLFSIEYGLV